LYICVCVYTYTTYIFSIPGVYCTSTKKNVKITEKL
jgi:hypothetical protein